MLTSIKNFYEQLVSERLQALLAEGRDDIDEDYLDDIACVALNRLPARYVRHTVDLAFHMNDDEWERVNKEVDDVVLAAIEFTRRRIDARPGSGDY